MSELPSRASEARDGTGATTPDATWFDDEATAGGGVPRRRERPVVVDSTEPGHGRETADRQAGRVANRAGQGEAPTGRATSATSGGGSAHTDTGRAVAVGGPPGSGSLIGDALLRELLENGLPPRRAESSSDSVVSDTVVFEVDPRHDSTVAVSPVLPVRDPACAPTTAGDSCPAAVHRNPDRRRPPPRGRPGWTPARRSRPSGRRTPGRDSPRRVARPAPPRVLPPGGTTVTAVLPGRTAATHPRGPPRTTARTRVTRRTPGQPKPAHPVRVPHGDRPGAGRSATSDTDGLGLGDLLAGALAAYRDI